MKHSLSYALGTFLIVALLPAPVTAQTVVPVGSFRSVTLRNGGKVILRHGAVQRVTLLKGSTGCTGVAIAEGGRLVIDRHRGDCPRGTDLEVEIITPEIDEISVEHGGTFQSRGSFPRQSELGAAVGNGGTIDIRSMTVDYVAAVVNQGGRIFTKPQDALLANIVQGGAVRYWGNARVKSSVEKGGAVTRGSAADADQPLSEFGPTNPPLPPIPAVPPIPTRRST